MKVNFLLIMILYKLKIILRSVEYTDYFHFCHKMTQYHYFRLS